MAGVKSNDSVYTTIRPYRKLHFEKLVTSFAEVLQVGYLNPFSPVLDAQQLYNISSGVPIEDRNQVLQLLNMTQIRIEPRDCFIQDRLVSGVTSFHSPVERNNLKLFTSTGRTVKMKIGKETSILQVNRNIMPKIISWPVKSGKVVDFKDALTYLLCPVPFIITFPNGSKRSTAKRKLLR